MSIGILYESHEWSSYALCDNINNMGIEAILFDLQEDGNEEAILACNLIISRVFASSVFRGHQKSLDRMPGIIDLLKQNNIPMVNPANAHYYEISKEHSTNTLARHGFQVPKVYGVFTPANITQSTAIEYPCIVKPDCGGRTNYTFIVHDKDQLRDCMGSAPHIEYIAEQYIRPAYGFLTRIEIIDHACRLILKRSVTENGLSAYHLGSTYAPYADCRDEIKQTAVRAMDLLEIETGSMDIIENESGFYIIDINSVSNASEDNTETFSFDLMKETAAYAVKKYRQLKGELSCK